MKSKDHNISTDTFGSAVARASMLSQNKDGLVEVAGMVTSAWEIRFRSHRGKVLRQLENLKGLETAERMLILPGTSTYIGEITCTKGFE